MPDNVKEVRTLRCIKALATIVRVFCYSVISREFYISDWCDTHLFPGHIGDVVAHAIKLIGDYRCEIPLSHPDIQRPC